MSKLFSISNPIFKQTIENQGCSMNMKSLIPDSGYMVSLKGMELKINVIDFSPEHVDHFIRKNLSCLFNKSCYIGTWINNDLVYLDISLNIKDKNQALEYAKANGQICIWDVEKKVEIYQLEEVL